MTILSSFARHGAAAAWAVLASLGMATAADFKPAPAAVPTMAVCDDDEDAPTDAFGFTDGAGIAARGGGSIGMTFNGDMGVRGKCRTTCS